MTAAGTCERCGGTVCIPTIFTGKLPPHVCWMDRPPEPPRKKRRGIALPYWLKER